MTTEEYIAKQRKIFSDILEKDIPLQRAAQSCTAQQATRIFVEGKNSAGGNIGQYDTKTPLYINPNKAPRKTADKVKGIEGLLPTRGKTGKAHFKNGEPHKTTYVNNYKDYRNRIGRRIDRMYLDLSGDLKSDFSNSPAGTKPNPIKVNAHEYVVGLKRDSNVLKLEGLEDRFGVVSKLTDKEQSSFFDVAGKEFKLILSA